MKKIALALALALGSSVGAPVVTSPGFAQARPPLPPPPPGCAYFFGVSLYCGQFKPPTR